MNVKLLLGSFIKLEAWQEQSIWDNCCTVTEISSGSSLTYEFTVACRKAFFDVPSTLLLTRGSCCGLLLDVSSFLIFAVLYPSSSTN